MKRTINVTVQQGVNPFSGQSVYRIYDQNGFLLGQTCETESEALNDATWRTGAELVVVNRTEINW